MAIKQIGLAPAPDKVTSSGGRGGGGKFGTVAGLGGGAVIGGLAAAAIPGAGPAAIAAGAMGGGAGGASLGGLIGEHVKPTKQASTAIERRIQGSAPQQIQSEAAEKLKQSLMALHEAPPEIKSRYAPTLMSAYLTESMGASGARKA